MSTDLERGNKVAAPARGLLPPYLVLRDFLDEDTVAGLLDYALSRQADFLPTRLASIRVSATLQDLGIYRSVLKTRILGLVPELIARLQMTPFEAPAVETELVAHGDGAFFKRHIDTGHRILERIRVLSGVYYFNAEPKAFTGGALRLHAIGDSDDFIDIEPMRNSLLVFPSWAPHEVIPVSVPSRRFADSRFAINCWMCRTAKPET
jgi:SM-20-related protein